MRILVDIGEKQIHALDTISKGAKRPRAALIREAVGEYLTRHRPQQEKEAFGLWGDRGIDGLAYQEKLRGEW